MQVVVLALLRDFWTRYDRRLWEAIRSPYLLLWKRISSSVVEICERCSCSIVASNSEACRILNDRIVVRETLKKRSIGKVKRCQRLYLDGRETRTDAVGLLTIAYATNIKPLGRIQRVLFLTFVWRWWSNVHIVDSLNLLTASMLFIAQILTCWPHAKQMMLFCLSLEWLDIWHNIIISKYSPKLMYIYT